MNSKRIVITGIGAIASIGIGVDNLFRNILQKKTNIKKKDFILNGELWDSFYKHTIDNFNINDFGLDDLELDRIKCWKEGDEIVDLYYLIAVIKLALDDANLQYDFDKDDMPISLVLAHENLNLTPFLEKVSCIAYDIFLKNKNITKKDFYEKIYSSCLKTGYDAQTFTGLFHIARLFKIHNYSLFINNACASGLFALENASEIIKTGRSSRVVIAAVDYPDIYKYLWFKKLGLYSKSGKIKPFSDESDGLMFGDGGAALVVESLESALERKTKIYAEFLGAGFSLEGWKITAPLIGGKFYQKAIIDALKVSKIKKNDVEVICPHGVGSKVIDSYESRAITDIFGEYPKALISTFKPYVGHNLGGSSLLETAILLVSLKNKIVPCTLDYKEKSKNSFNISLLKEHKSFDFKICLKLCCAFAGYNSAAIFRNFE
ncbi:hypothetical protein HQ550_04065 [bacterium]|nr:hypothetical protein [bacterium]